MPRFDLERCARRVRRESVPPLPAAWHNLQVRRAAACERWLLHGRGCRQPLVSLRHESGVPRRRAEFWRRLVRGWLHRTHLWCVQGGLLPRPADVPLVRIPRRGRPPWRAHEHNPLPADPQRGRSAADRALPAAAARVHARPQRARLAPVPPMQAADEAAGGGDDRRAQGSHLVRAVPRCAAALPSRALAAHL